MKRLCTPRNVAGFSPSAMLCRDTCSDTFGFESRAETSTLGDLSLETGLRAAGKIFSVTTRLIGFVVSNCQSTRAWKCFRIEPCCSQIASVVKVQ